MYVYTEYQEEYMYFSEIIVIQILAISFLYVCGSERVKKLGLESFSQIRTHLCKKFIALGKFENTGLYGPMKSIPGWHHGGLYW